MCVCQVEEMKTAEGVSMKEGEESEFIAPKPSAHRTSEKFIAQLCHTKSDSFAITGQADARMLAASER